MGMELWIAFALGFVACFVLTNKSAREAVGRFVRSLGKKRTGQEPPIDKSPARYVRQFNPVTGRYFVVDLQTERIVKDTEPSSEANEK